jgi:ABC-type phosphate transport system substrate-binding protein
MKKLLIAIGFIFSASAFSGVAVIVHPSNADALGDTEISRIFLGKMKTFPGGGQAIPINQSEGSAPRGDFEKKVLNKSASQIKAYWSKLVFTGKGTPPKEVSSDAEVIDLIKSNPNLIGYVDESAVTGDVKVIATF